MDNFLLLVGTLCLPGVCPDPGGVPFATRTQYSGPYNPGDQVTYTCQDGESANVTCQSNGSWTDKPTCTGQSGLQEKNRFKMLINCSCFQSNCCCFLQESVLNQEEFLSLPGSAPLISKEFSGEVFIITMIK